MTDRSLRALAARHALRTALSAPEPLLRPLLGPPPRNDRGHQLDFGVSAFLRVASIKRGPTRGRPIAALRHEMDHHAPLADFARGPMHRVYEREVPGDGHAIRVRIYEPGPRGAEARPLCVFFHGGGFCTGSLRSHDGLCSRIARRADCVVVAVDYRLAPEHRFPAAALDAIAAYRWAVAHAPELGADRSRVSVAGDSAGGNLAAVVAWHERQERERPCFQLLVYPTTDFESHETNESFQLYGEGFLHDAAATRFFRNHYLGGCRLAAADPRASVLRAPDLRGVAPAHVVTAGFDPLRDEGERYARQLAGAGVRATLRCEETLVHGFFSLGGVIEAARRAADRAIDALAAGMRR